jgi:hypothetical protein
LENGRIELFSDLATCMLSCVNSVWGPLSSDAVVRSLPRRDFYTDSVVVPASLVIHLPKLSIKFQLFMLFEIATSNCKAGGDVRY